MAVYRFLQEVADPQWGHELLVSLTTGKVLPLKEGDVPETYSALSDQVYLDKGRAVGQLNP